MYLLVSKLRFLVLATIQPGRSLLQFVTMNCLIIPIICDCFDRIFLHSLPDNS